MATDSRDAMIRATVDLLRERGYAGTSLGDVLQRSGGPRGSIYHHFPGGKQELVAEAVRRFGNAIRRSIAAAAERGSGADTVAALLAGLRDGLLATDFGHGCAIAGVVLDLTPAEHDLLVPVAAALADWQAVLAQSFVRDGVAPERARRLAAFVLAAVEGGLILARAAKDITPLDDVATELAALLASAT